MDGLLPVAVVALAIVLVLVFLGVRSVSQGQEYTVERFGRYTHTLHPGLNLIVPFVDRIGAKLNMMEQVLDVPSQQAITKDNAVVTADGIVFYQILDASKAAYEITNLDSAILNLTMTNVRTVMGSMDLDELLSKRDEINAKLLQVVDEATTPWGVKVTRIEIKDITPPQDLIDSMGRQMKAERDKRAAILTAEGERSAAILKAEGEKQAAVLEAEGRLEAASRDAQARERLAEAEAKAATMLGQAMNEGGKHAVNYYVAQKYLETLREFAHSSNQKLLLLPMETTGVLGTLAGIAELGRDAFGDRAAPSPRPTMPWGERKPEG